MKIGTTEIKGKIIKVHEMEFLYTYTNDSAVEFAVFEFDGLKVEAEVRVFKKSEHKL
jgi:hypothetical protein